MKGKLIVLLSICLSALFLCEGTGYTALARYAQLSPNDVKQVMQAIGVLIRDLKVGGLDYRYGTFLGGETFTTTTGFVVQLSLWLYNEVCDASPRDHFISSVAVRSILWQTHYDLYQEAIYKGWGIATAVKGFIGIAYEVISSGNQEMTLDVIHPNSVDRPFDVNDCAIYSTSITSGPFGPGTTLFSGTYLTSSRIRLSYSFKLEMQTDCNLVLRSPTNIIMWASNSYGKGEGCAAHLQMDGNLVVKDASGRPIWSPNKYCHDQPNCIQHASLVAQQDGNVVLYHFYVSSTGDVTSSAVWASGTSG